MVQHHHYDFDITRDGPKFTDPDGDALSYTFSWELQPWQGVTLNGSHLVVESATVGSFPITMRVTDGTFAVFQSVVFEIVPNAVPTMAVPHELVLVAPDNSVDLDVSRGNTHVVDADGDSLTYDVKVSPNVLGLAATGTHVSGTVSGVGAVRVSVTVSDPYGAKVSEQFNIAAPGPDPGRPVLPATRHVYDDLTVGLPGMYLEDLGKGVALFYDTTPAVNPITDAGATLGRVLFYDKRLSSTNTHSCGSCHEQQHGFANVDRFPMGAAGERGTRNAMAIVNARFNIHNKYFGDQRTDTLEALALQPIENQTELANTVPNALRKLREADFYPPLFQAAFGTPEISADRVAKALAQFVRSLVSYRARVDEAYPGIRGIADPAFSPLLTAQENLGASLFISGTCGHCHTSMAFIGLDPRNNGLDEVPADPGAGNGEFRVASLRNIARTAPYMHDGRFATLREVIDHYDHGVKDSAHTSLRSGFRLNLTEEEKLALEAFLLTFTDDAMLSDPKFSDPFH